MPAIRFETNVPQEVRLTSLEGVSTPSQFGGNQIKFATDRGALYVSEAVGAILGEQIAKQGVKPGEPVEICKRETSLGNGRKGIRWELSRTGFVPGPQADGTFVLPKPSEASELERKLKASIEYVNNGKAPAQAAWTDALVGQTTALIDAYAAVLKHLARHEGLIAKDDVRSIFLSAFINISKGGSNRAA